jgi:hypothetical protein
MPGPVARLRRQAVLRTTSGSSRGVSRSDPASFSSVEEALDTVPAVVVVDYTHADAVKGHVVAALGRRVCRARRRIDAPGPYVAGTLLAILAVPRRVGLTRSLDQLL